MTLDSNAPLWDVSSELNPNWSYSCHLYCNHDDGTLKINVLKPKQCLYFGVFSPNLWSRALNRHFGGHLPISHAMADVSSLQMVLVTFVCMDELWVALYYLKRHKLLLSWMFPSLALHSTHNTLRLQCEHKQSTPVAR